MKIPHYCNIDALIESKRLSRASNKRAEMAEAVAEPSVMFHDIIIARSDSVLASLLNNAL
jgi:hypothetical protein